MIVLSQRFNRGFTAIRQVAALPYRIDDEGQLRLMLITSRETQRWVIPKGNPMKALERHEAAAQEAYEEGGLLGIPHPQPIGSYPYVKRRAGASGRRTIVDVYPFTVTGQAEKWPEQHERGGAWFTPAEAAEAVEEPELRILLLDFTPPRLKKKGPPPFEPRIRRKRRSRAPV